MLTFKALGLSSNLLKGIEDLGFKHPTLIQEKIIPNVFETKRDIVGLAQTGTGKTAAFGLPLIDRIDIQNKSVQVLVLAPTRELCVQISKDLKSFAKFTDGLNVVPVYGGASIEVQIKALRKGAHIITATPGRMLDLIKRKAAKIKTINTVVLDEADEMLNMGFREELNQILEQTPDTKRTLLFSATMPREVSIIAKKYMSNPIEIIIGKQNSGAENVQHIYYFVQSSDRYMALKRIADYNPDIYGIVFCRTRMQTKEVAEKLIKDGYNADALHGELSQAQRDGVMKRFREKTLHMLVATDVAARGLDVHDITHVINYNLPEELDIYTHRSGRTGRADKSGISISIVSSREKNKMPQIEKMINKKIEQRPVPTGSEICNKQLLNFIDRMKNVEIDEVQIAPFMDIVNSKLKNLSKEEIIKHFVSLEFKRFLEYYKNASDLTVKPKPERQRESRNRNKRDKNVPFDIHSKKSNGGYVRFFINVGKKNGIDPKNIIGMINDNTGDRDINIGAIDIKNDFSFFEVGEKYLGKILHSFRNVKYKWYKIRVEVAQPAENDRINSRHKEYRKRI